MMKKNNLGRIITLIGVVASLTAAITAFLMYRDKLKKEEEDLEEYLDCSILWLSKISGSVWIEQCNFVLFCIDNL